MIKEFNKNGAVALYKREFADCLEKADYEGAIDNLLKYSEVRDNPDFHAAMGILYFLMTQDSDDRELLPLSYREFLMHLSANPNSRVAYRSLLAIAILRREPASIAHISDFIKQCGQDVQELVDELSEYGLDIFNDDSEYIDFDGMFTPADYGEIASDAVIFAPEDGDVIDSIKSDEPPPPKNKVIKFKGRSGEEDIAKVPSEQKIIRIKNDESQDEKIELGDMFDMMMQLIQGDAEDSAEQTDDIAIAAAEISDDQTDDLYAKFALKRAQSFCVSGKYEEALCELDTIKRDTGRLYYCAECVRANIMMDMSRYDEAQLALDRALAVVPGGALAGTIQCALYAELKQFDKIPDVLKGIDVTDYVDSDHVFRALRFAIEYCTPEDAMALLEDYIDEFNSLDLRSIHAQMLYNAGERDAAKKELRVLSRVLYDDFGAQYHYLMAKSGIEAMPLTDDTPQNILGIVVENIIGLAHSDVFSTDLDNIINSEPFRYGLEVFLTLEFQNTRSVTKLMFETLNILSDNERLETAMRNALVSPYVEPLVKAVILGRILHRHNGKTRFLAEQSFRPLSDAGLPSVGENCDAGVYLAYALTVMLCPRELPFLIEHYGKMRLTLCGAEFSSRDTANYLWRTVRAHAGYKDAEVDGRMHFVLGYDTKTQANAAYKDMCALLQKF